MPDPAKKPIATEITVREALVRKALLDASATELAAAFAIPKNQLVQAAEILNAEEVKV